MMDEFLLHFGCRRTENRLQLTLHIPTSAGVGRMSAYLDLRDTPYKERLPNEKLINEEGAGGIMGVSADFTHILPRINMALKEVLSS